MRIGRAAGLAAIVGGLVLAGALRASAQDRSRAGVFGGLEFAHITEDEGLLGTGPGAHGGVAVWLTRATAVEFEIGATHHVRTFLFYGLPPGGPPFAPVPFHVRWSGTAVFGIARVTHAFGRGTVRPVVWGGAGVMHQGGTRHEVTDDGGLPFSDEERLSESPSVTTFVLDAGGGVDIAAGGRWRIRPYGGFRLTGAGGYGPKYIIRTGADVAVRW